MAWTNIPVPVLNVCGNESIDPCSCREASKGTVPKAREMVQSVKNLPCKHEGLSLILQNLQKILEGQCLLVIPVLQVETAGFLEPASQPV